ncbi:MAG: alanine--tRNA ligase, partial [Clostridia bacterium]|nr:alanine--tRNA ligase [Clostridia bacterium]
MKNLTVKELKKMWIDFFTNHNHKQIQGSSLVPETDSSVMFTTAGMQPLVPYLLGKPHPQGKRLFNVQRCLRTNDIDSVGDANHFTFFEMLGNWSLGDYFKEEAIKNSFEFLTSPKYLGLPVERLAVTVFEGDESAPRDTESAEIWEKNGMPKEKIFFLGKDNNWWSAGDTGPCGPDTEMFYITDVPACGEHCSPACDCGHYVEIGNNVFMQYVVKNAGDKPELLSQKNVDTGMGLERNVAALNGYKSAYEIDVMKGAIEVLSKISTTEYESSEIATKSYRIIVDHLRASTFVLGDEHRVSPSNVGQGYVLRRLIRRAVTYAKNIGTDISKFSNLVDYYVEYYKDELPILEKNHQVIIEELNAEVKKFNNTLSAGMKEFDKAIGKVENGCLNGAVAFRLHDTFGFPIELTKELAGQKGIKVDMEGYKNEVVEHQKLSRASLTEVFKGGLASQGEMETKYHTLTHLVLQTLIRMFGSDVQQRGSNITAERMR